MSGNAALLAFLTEHNLLPHADDHSLGFYGNYRVFHRNTSFYCASLYCALLILWGFFKLFLNKLKVCGNLVLNKSVSLIVFLLSLFI